MKKDAGNREEISERQKELNMQYQAIYQKRMADTTDEEIYKSMYEHISDVFGPWLTDHACSGELKLVRKYLKKYGKSAEQRERIENHIKAHGAYCDCEFVLNCPPEMNK